MKKFNKINLDIEMSHYSSDTQNAILLNILPSNEGERSLAGIIEEVSVYTDGVMSLNIMTLVDRYYKNSVISDNIESMGDSVRLETPFRSVGYNIGDPKIGKFISIMTSYDKLASYEDRIQSMQYVMNFIYKNCDVRKNDINKKMRNNCLGSIALVYMTMLTGGYNFASLSFSAVITSISTIYNIGMLVRYNKIEENELIDAIVYKINNYDYNQLLSESEVVFSKRSESLLDFLDDYFTELMDAYKDHLIALLANKDKEFIELKADMNSDDSVINKARLMIGVIGNKIRKLSEFKTSLDFLKQQARLLQKKDARLFEESISRLIYLLKEV